jgi:hypothetical protein
MKFGIFYELSVPRPWDQEAERKVYMNALEQVRLADELGFDQVWAVEHHFLEEYSHCSAPELFLTACAMQTKNIHVGHGNRYLRARVQSSDSHRRTCCCAGYSFWWASRIRYWSLCYLDRAGRISRQS